MGFAFMNSSARGKMASKRICDYIPRSYVCILSQEFSHYFLVPMVPSTYGFHFLEGRIMPEFQNNS